ncbi:hypothetical protein SDC9_148171 [bioreactor metagenome]|uniref:Uncharacterized protein n=1 Tax=bioreactor metagenome TaxID=1076179 RepID=A0A645EK87_9ZZZZ
MLHTPYKNGQSQKTIDDRGYSTEVEDIQLEHTVEFVVHRILLKIYCSSHSDGKGEDEGDHDDPKRAQESGAYPCIQRICRLVRGKE